MTEIVLAAEPGLDTYRLQLADLLERAHAVHVVDANVVATWDDTDELMRFCAEAVVGRHDRFAALVSLSGSGLSMSANKILGVRSAVLPDRAYLADALQIGANMCEVSSAMLAPEAAADLFLEFAAAKEIKND